MSKGASSARAQLRAAVRELSGGRCEWFLPCSTAGEELAHIEPRGMGGRASVDRIGNVAWLCRSHHDLLDLRRWPDSEEQRQLAEYLGKDRSEVDAIKASRLLRDEMKKHLFSERRFLAGEEEETE